ncbi:hypothetical protein P1X14_10755 [Sphingomonas sp. AOB5]|uniref:hypothetical protein n=1 Tax=Sphingomonas sp. AOB5 TaxID=3034017 RepID=UPI0023FA2AA2|nr:hypothetical protein [Sphingomonas sp. AOB5]MDF7775726.1 hypothetical protein [Sphingomonas sp. AOB5]
MSLGSLFRRWFGGKPAPSPAPVPATPSAADESFDARLRFWEAIGTVESDVISHLISPGLMGGPAWPTTRQAYRVIRRANGATILATDGLSDPFDDGADGNGYGMEVFIECADLPPELAGTPGDVTPLQKSWMFALLSHVAGIVASNGGIVPLLDRYGGLLSMELPGVSESGTIQSQIPEHYVTADDVLGVLIGGPAPDFSNVIPGMPLSPVRAVPIVLLTAGELAEVRAGDETTRLAVADALAKQPYTHVNRDSLV